jgi:hypothetical protein
MLFPRVEHVIFVDEGNAMAPDQPLFVEMPLPPDGLLGKTFNEMLAFHRDRGIPHLRNDDPERHRVRYYFADPVDAIAFRDRFGREREMRGPRCVGRDSHSASDAGP